MNLPVNNFKLPLREEGEDVEYDVDWELIRRATETPFQPGDLSLATAFQTLGWMEVDDGEKPPLLPIQDGLSLVPEPETPQPPRPVHPSLRPGATMKEIKEEALRRFPETQPLPDTPVLPSNFRAGSMQWNSPERIKYLDWYLKHMRPIEHPDYIDAYNERWSEFIPGHPSFLESDQVNVDRWKRKAAAGLPALPESLRPVEQEKNINDLGVQKGGGKGKSERRGYMAFGGGDDEQDVTSENHLFVLLDSGCNKTCHGDRWLQRYQRAVGVDGFRLSEDLGGSFRGIGGKISTNGVRHLDVSFELEDGGLAVGDLNSVELADSDAPLLLSVADQRQLGLVLELDDSGDRVYSRTLKNNLKVNRVNGLVGIRLLPSDLLGISKSHGLSDSETSPGFEEASLGFEAAPTGFGAMDSHCESALDLGPPVLDQTSRENYLSIEEVPRKTLTRGQKKTLDQCRKEVIESDVSMWSTLSVLGI